MADENVGSLHIEVDASAQKLGANLEKANAHVDKFAKSARKSLADVDSGFLSKLGQRAKGIEREHRASGASALEKLMGGGLGGMLEIAGGGLSAMVVDKVGQSAVSLLKGFGDMAQSYRTGQKGKEQLLSEAMGQIPLLGTGFKMGEAAYDMMYALTGNEKWMSPAAREKRDMGFSEQLIGLGRQIKMAPFDLLESRAQNPYDKQAIALEKSLATLNSDYSEKLLKNASSGLNPNQQASIKLNLDSLHASGVLQNEADFHALDLGEHRRRAESIMGMEREIAQERLSIQKSSAQDVGGVWFAMEHSIVLEIGSQLDAVKFRLKNDPTLSPMETDKLHEQMTALETEKSALIGRARVDFNRSVGNDQLGVAGGLLSSMGAVLSDYAAMPGSNSPQLERLQRMIAVRGESLSRIARYRGVLQDPLAAPWEKGIAKSLLEQNPALTELQLKNAGVQPYVPLRLAPGEQASQFFGGAADYAREQDLSHYSKDHADASIDVQKKMVDLLQEIADNTGSGTPLFGEGAAN